MFEKGQILENKYEIIEHIGTGGGGIVYKARHLGLDRYVAIKQIKEEVIGVLKKDMEADVLKDLKNNYVPTVFDFINSGGQVYTVMEFVEGQSFQQLLDEGRKFSQRKILKYARQLCEAAAYLHSRKRPIIHSDIKPANIMLTSEDNICLIDYNISLFVDGNENAIGVSAGYSPPEQYGSKTPAAAKNAVGTNPGKGSAENITGSETLGDPTDILTASDCETLIDNDNAEDDLLTQKLTDSSAVPINPDDKTLIERNDEYTQALILDNDADATEILTEKKESFQKPISENNNTNVKRKVDVRSDIYSIGASLYHIALGKRPAVSTGNVIPLSKADSRISESFAAIIDKAMQKDPAKRFKSAEKMLAALNNLNRYDRRYRNLLIRQEIAALFIILTMAASLLTAVMGYMRIGDEISDQYNWCISVIDSADFANAEKYYSKAIGIYPERAEAYEKMAFLIYDSGDYEYAAEYISGIIYGDPLYIGEDMERYSYDKLYYILGRCYLETEQYELSAEALEKAVSENDDVNYYCDYAAALARCGNIQKAENILEIAVQNGLSDSDIFFVRGEIDYASEDYLKCIESINNCVEISSDDTLLYRAYMVGANAYRAAFNKDHAIGDKRIGFLNNAINKLPFERTMPFYEMLAQAYIDKAVSTDSEVYYSGAISTYEKMHSLGWETIDSDYTLTRLYRMVGNYGYAKEFALSLLERSNEDYVIYKLLAFIESNIQEQKENSDRDYTDFCFYYERAKELCTDSTDPEMVLLGDAYEKLKKENLIGG